MTDVAYTRRAYDAHGQEYHEKRQSPRRNFWNLFIDTPAMAALLKRAVRGKRVLDAGCGSGIFTGKLKTWGAKVTGCDLSKTLVEIARREHPGIPFLVCDAQKTPFKTGSFDIVSSNLLLHYFKDPTPFLREMRRVLRPGGRLIFSFHHPFNEGVTKIRIGNRTGYDLTASCTPYFHNKQYTWTMISGTMEMISYHHTFEHVATALHKAGFVIELIKEPRPAPKTRKYGPKHYDRTTRYPSFCVIQARKE